MKNHPIVRAILIVLSSFIMSEALGVIGEYWHEHEVQNTDTRDSWYSGLESDEF